MGLTKSVLKRPVTVVMVILCLIVFGLQSVPLAQSRADADHGNAGYLSCIPYIREQAGGW